MKRNSVRSLMSSLGGCLLVVAPSTAQTPSATIPGAGTDRDGPLAIHIYTLRLPPGECPHPNPAFDPGECLSLGDTLPVGPDLFYTFGVFDTGSSVVLINNEPAGLNDADLLNLCGPAGNCTLPVDPTMTAPFLPLSLDLRLWGLARVDPTTLGAPLDVPEQEVQMLQVRPAPGETPTLIGAPVAARSVAHIDYTTIVSRTYAFGTIEAPNIVFHSPGSPGIPNAPYAFELVRRGSFTTALDGASVGPRYDMRRVRFEHQGNALTDANFEILYDTGNTTTQMTEAAAIALGIDPVNDVPADVFNINTVNGVQQVKGFVIDEFSMTTEDGLHRSRIANPLVYVRPDLMNPTRPPFPSGIDVVMGSNYFDQQALVFDGPGDRLRLFTAEPIAQPPGDLDADGDVDRDDMTLLLQMRNSAATGPEDPADLDGDGWITVLDARVLATLCTRARCAV